MGQVSEHSPVLPLLAAFSRHAEALDWARERAVDRFGPVALASPIFDFAETDYYEATMGPGLKKVFFTFERLVHPAALPEIKRLTNTWEEEYAAAGHTEPRPLNLDPGYFSLGKLVLASTKDHAHRLYLSQGIHAEVTLVYRNRGWQPNDWTYPDYRRTDFQAFFSECREWLRRRLREDANA